MVTSNAVAISFGAKTIPGFDWIMTVFVAASTLGTLNNSVNGAARYCYNSETTVPTVL